MGVYCRRIRGKIHSGRRAFSMVDLMIVLAIIGILAAFAVPIYKDYVRKSRESEAMRALGSIQVAQAAYKTDPVLGNGEYADNLTALGWSLDKNGSTTGVAPARYKYSTNSERARAVAGNGDAVNHATIELTHTGQLEYP